MASAPIGVELVAVLLERFVVLLVGQQLADMLRSVSPGSIDDEVLEVEHALEVAQRHVEHQADAGRQRLQEPDVRHRAGQLDVAHALAAHLGERDFDAALFADDALVLHALILAAQALVVLCRAKDLAQNKPSRSGLNVR